MLTASTTILCSATRKFTHRSRISRIAESKTFAPPASAGLRRQESAPPVARQSSIRIPPISDNAGLTRVSMWVTTGYPSVTATVCANDYPRIAFFPNRFSFHGVGRIRQRPLSAIPAKWGHSMDVPDRKADPVYSPHQFQCDWAWDGRTCMVCGLLEGGANHSSVPEKNCSCDAASHGVRFVFESDRTALSMDVPETGQQPEYLPRRAAFSRRAVAVTFPTPTLSNSFTPQQNLYLQEEYDRQVRNPSTALVLTLLLGGLGAHRFYLQQWGWGIAYFILAWTFIPLVVSLIECFLIRKRTEDYNKKCAELITEKMNVIIRRQRRIEEALQ